MGRFAELLRGGYALGMVPRWRRVIQLFELARVELLLAGISNVWLMVFLAGAVEPGTVNPQLGALGLPLSLVLSALCALGLVGCGMALNDVVDARHDRKFEPQRPIPAGRLDPTNVVSAAMLSLILAVGAAVWLGTASAMLALLAAGGVLFYNIAGRFVPAVGIVSLGLMTAVSMLVPNPRASFVWPVALTMTHVMACATLRYWLAGKRPRLTALDGVGICMGWAFWVLLLVTFAGRPAMDAGVPAAASGVDGTIWVGPIVAMFAFVGLSLWLLAGASGSARDRRSAASRFGGWSARWLIVYDAAWLVSAGLWAPAAVIAALFLAGWVTAVVSAYWDWSGAARPAYRVE